MERRTEERNGDFIEQLKEASASLAPKISILDRLRYNWYYSTNYALRNDKYPPSKALIGKLIKNTPYADTPLVTQMPRIESSKMTPSLFRKAVRCNTPFIVEGFLEKSKVTKWDIDYLDKIVGDKQCSITIDESYVRELDDKEYFDNNYLGTYREVFDDIRSGSARRKYITANADALMDSPRLMSELPINSLRSHVQMGFILAQLFIGGKGTGSTLHAAVQRNVFLMVGGEKEWTMAHPSAGPLLRARMNRLAFFTYSPYNLATTYDPNMSNDPLDSELLHRVRFMRGKLSPSDILFNPPWWWHAVKNVTENTIGVSTRWGGPTFYRESLINSVLHFFTPHQLRIGIHVLRYGIPPDRMTRNVRLANRGSD